MVQHDSQAGMAFEYAAIDEQRRGETRIVKVAYKIAKKVAREGTGRRRFKGMNTYRHRQRFGGAPENLEIRFVELPLNHLRRNLDAAQPELPGPLQFFGGRHGILHRDGSERNEMLAISRSERHHRVVVYRG